MAALQEPNPYHLDPQPTPHADPKHVHRFVTAGYERRCIYCHVEEVFALRALVADLKAENADLKAAKREAAGYWLELYRRVKDRYTTLKMVRDFCAHQIALAQWPDVPGDDDE